MTYAIRPARVDDAEAISDVIVAALHVTNARDYSEAVIARVALNFSPDRVLILMQRRTMIVATLAGCVVGTASLEGGLVQTVFVHPDHQGRGVGRRLMAAIERAARDDGVTTLTVPASVTAEPFYAALGYRAVRDRHYGEERTIEMERALPASA
ncbi:GNAT family N-acetyltransferase [Methylobacterium sp. JK268]